MTYQAHNKPKSDSFSKIISFCNNLLPNYHNFYVQSVHNGLNVMQGRHFRGAARVYKHPKNLRF